MPDFFSPDYRTARDRFRTSVLSLDGQVESILLNTKGPSGEDLTIDIGWFGDPQPSRALLHTCGLHGVEGFAGSAIQLQYLSDQETMKFPPDTAVVLIHVLNPFGMAWLRRVNESNVDLNRNFVAADEEYSGAPESYRALNTLLNPETPPSRDWFGFRAKLKRSRLRDAVLHGQYEYPRGLFYGGRRREQAARRLQVYFSGRFAAVERLASIDVHTGRGKYAEDILLVNDAEGREALCAEMQSAFGDRVQPADSAPEGTWEALLLRMFPASRIYSAVQKFGTGSDMKILTALREENRAYFHGNAAQQQSLKQVFCPDDARWRTNVLARGREVISQALELIRR